MSKILIVKNSKNSCVTSEVLYDNGFETVSSWCNNNIFKKGNNLFRISHPVWEGKNVRTEVIS